MSPPQSASNRAALLSPRGRGAVATVRLVGDCRVIDASPALFRAANGHSLHQQPINRIVFGQWGIDVAEDVVLCRIDDSVTEIHCHGGQAAAAAILSDLQSRGCDVVSWQELVEQQAGAFDAECLTALTRATTTRTADLLLEQQSGLLRREIESIRQLGDDGKAAETIAARLDALLQWSEFGLHLSKPWDVVIAGRPNVGKSSLINALVGFSRSIVFDRPGTTRDVVTAETALDGWPIRLSDTAGLRAEGDDIERAGIQRARTTLAAADCRVLLFDTSRPPHDDDRQLVSDWPEAIRIAHKCDLPNVWSGLQLQDALSVSSITGDGIQELTRRLVRCLVPYIPPAGTPLPVTQRQIDLLERARHDLAAGNTGRCRAWLDELLIQRGGGF